MLNLSFVFTGYLNGRPYWTSTQYGMQITWMGNYWEIINWPYDGIPLNFTDTDIPLTGWQLTGNTSITADFTVNLGECCFEYSFVNNTLGSTLTIEYIDCSYNTQYLKIDYGVSGSFCATSVTYASDSGSYSLLGNLCPPAPTPSITPTISISATPYITPSVTPTITPSKTPSISISTTPSVTPSISISTTPGVSITPSITPSTTPSITPSITPSVSGLNYTFITNMTAQAPCNFPEYNIYLGNDGKYYASDDGGNTYILMDSISEFWFELIGYDPNFLADVFTAWTINETSTVLTNGGNLLQNC
jgi:hypothetical protein